MISNMLASFYSFLLPKLSEAAMLCKVNGKEVPCSSDAFVGASSSVTIVWLILMVLLIASAWRIFSKASKPGWASIIPIYNVIVMLQIVKKTSMVDSVTINPCC